MTQQKQPEAPAAPAPTVKPQPVQGYFVPGSLLQATIDQLRNSTSPNRTVNEVNRMLESLSTLPPATFVPDAAASPPNRSTRRKAAAKPRGRRPKKG